MTPQWAIFHGDALDLLRTLPDASVDSIVTDPPAGISFMGARNSWDSDKGGRAQWVAWLTEITRECLRALKPGGHALFWALPRTSHWTATAVEDGGFEVRDVITHHWGGGMPHSLDASKAIDKKLGTTAQREVFATYVAGGNAGTSTADKGGTYGVGVANSAPVELTRTLGGSPEARRWDGFGTNLKPSQERWILAQKPMSTLDTLVRIEECLSRWFANIAGKNSSSNLEELIQPGSAAANVVQMLTTKGVSFEKTDTLGFGSVKDTSLSIVSSWQSILVDVSKLASTSIIATEFDLIIDLRILSFLTSQITHENIVEAVSNPNGSTSLVLHVARFFDDLRAKCDVIRHRIATVRVGKSDNERSENGSLETANVDPTGVGSEDCVLARKPLVGTLADNLLRHGAGAVNIDGCRVGTDWNEPDRPESWARSAHSAKPDAEKIAAPPGVGMQLHPGGRWPTNAVLTHSDCNGGCAPECPVRILEQQSGGTAARFFPRFEWSGEHDDPFCYTAKASTREREAGCDAIAPNENGRRNDHSTVKSIALMRWLVRLVTPPGGVCLDIFAGSGSTGCAAVLEGFHFMGFELDAHFCDIARARIAHWSK